MTPMTKAEIRAAQRLLAEHDAEHYDLPLDDPKVLACAFCGVADDEDEAPTAGRQVPS